MARITLGELPVSEELNLKDTTAIVGGSIRNILRLSGQRNGEGPIQRATFTVSGTGRLSRSNLSTTQRSFGSAAAANSALAGLRNRPTQIRIRSQSGGITFSSNSNSLLSSWQSFGG